MPVPAVEAASPPSTVWAWGDNYYNQLGNGTTINNSDTPVPVSLPSGATITAIAGGGFSFLALGSDGTVWAWGDNKYGELGNGTTTDSNIPVQVNLPNGVTITAIAAGEEDSFALASNGTVWAWGDNIYGQLGDGAFTNSDTPVDTPVQVSLHGELTITAIAAGFAGSLALASNGTVWAWGFAMYSDSSTPVQVSLPSGVTITAIAAGGNGLALASDGTVWTWDYSIYNNTPNTPAQVGIPSGVSITAIAAGWDHNLVLASDGTVWAWDNSSAPALDYGVNNYGELGDGTTTVSLTPVQVNLPNWVTTTAISAGAQYSLALGSNGTVWAWGLNDEGQLGNGTTTNSDIPVPLSMPNLPSGVKVTAIAAGAANGLALSSNIPQTPAQGTTVLSISASNLQILTSFGLPPASNCYVPIPGSTNQYYNLLWNYGSQLDVPDTLKSPATNSNDPNTYTRLSGQDINGKVTSPGDCVSAADALSNYTFGADWSKGDLVMAAGTTVAPGTVIATFLSPDGAYTGHTAIFEGYTYDANSNRTGFWVWDQNWLDPLEEFGTHVISTGTGTGDASNYYEVLIPQTQLSATSIENGGGSISDSDSIAVNISGSSAADGTNVTLTSSYYGDTQPSGTTILYLAGSSYYDINVSSISILGDNAVAEVRISNPLITSQTLMLYYDGQNWNNMPDITMSGTTISGFLPVSALSGTFFVIGNQSTTIMTLTSSANSSNYGQLVTFSADVNPIPDGGTIQFQDNGVSISQQINIDISGQAICTTSALSIGTHTITAVYNGDASFASSTGTLTQTVDPSPILKISADSEVSSILQAEASDFYNDTGIVLDITTESDSQAIQDLNNGDCDIAGVGSASGN
jgi:alpha-tubulin suppressor-like RCC1 family protein